MVGLRCGEETVTIYVKPFP